MKKILFLIANSMINSMPPKLERQDISRNKYDERYDEIYNRVIHRYNELENLYSELSLLKLEDENFIVKKDLATKKHELLTKTMFRFKILVKRLLEKKRRIVLNYDENDDILNDILNDINNDDMNVNLNMFRQFNTCNRLFSDIVDYLKDENYSDYDNDDNDDNDDDDDDDYENYINAGEHLYIDYDYDYDFMTEFYDRSTDQYNYDTDIFSSTSIFLSENSRLYNEVIKIFNSNVQENTSKND